MPARHARGIAPALPVLVAAALATLTGCAPGAGPLDPGGPRTPSAAGLPTTAGPGTSTATLVDPCTMLTATKAATLLGTVGKGIDKATTGTVRNAGGTSDPSCSYTGADPARQLTVSRSTQLDAAMANALMTLSFKGTIARLKGLGDRAEHDGAQQRDDGLTVQTLMVRVDNVVTTVSFASKVSVAAYGDHAQQLIAVYRALPTPSR